MSEYDESQETELLEDQMGDEDESLSLDALISEAQEEAEQEAAPTKEEAAENRERAERLAGKFNKGLWWSLSKVYPAAEVEEEKIEEGKAALVPLAEKYGDALPGWVEDFMERPEIKAGVYVGTAIIAARNSHIAAVTKQEEEANQQGGNIGN